MFRSGKYLDNSIILNINYFFTQNIFFTIIYPYHLHLQICFLVYNTVDIPTNAQTTSISMRLTLHLFVFSKNVSKISVSKYAYCYFVVFFRSMFFFSMGVHINNHPMLSRLFPKLIPVLQGNLTWCILHSKSKRWYLSYPLRLF